MMEETKLGHNGPRVTRMGLGLAALGRPGYINLGHRADLGADYDVAAMRAHAHAVLDAAWACGIRLFDAARSYGRAEEFLGTWLTARELTPDDLTVSSKWGYTYTAGWSVDADVHEVKDHSRPVFERQWQETKERLGAFVRLYQVHSATFSSGILANRAVISALADLKASGVQIGLSLSGPDQAEVLRAAMEVTVEGVALFDAVQATWNLLEPSAAPALAQAADRGMGVIVKEALANGRLTARNHRDDDAQALRLLAEEAQAQRVSLDALALAAALAQPWATTVLSGAATPAQVHSNVAAFDVPWATVDAERLAAMAQQPGAYWQQRSDLAWN